MQTQTQAAKEASLEKALAKMKADWQGVAFRVVPYKDTGTCVIGGTDDVQASDTWVVVCGVCLHGCVWHMRYRPH